MAEYEAACLVGVERVAADREGVREESVVGVEEDDGVAGGGREAGVSRRGETLPPLTQAPHLWVSAGDLGRIVLRAVVDDDDVGRRAGLRQDALERVREEPPLIEARDDDGDAEVACHVSGTTSRLARSEAVEYAASGRSGPSLSDDGRAPCRRDARHEATRAMTECRG